MEVYEDLCYCVSNNLPSTVCYYNYSALYLKSIPVHIGPRYKCKVYIAHSIILVYYKWKNQMKGDVRMHNAKNYRKQESS